MVCGKTKTGFPFCVKKRTLQSMNLLEALAEAEEGNPLAVAKVVNLILGAEQKKKLYEHLAGEDGLVMAEDVNLVITEIMEAYGQEGKNSAPSAG